MHADMLRRCRRRGRRNGPVKEGSAGAIIGDCSNADAVVVT